MEEKELVQLTQEGNEEAFSALVKKYRTKVFNLAFSFTGDREIADDLAQEVFIKAYFALSKFKLKSEFGTWLYRITVNHAKDYLRKRGRIRKVFFEETMGNFIALEDEIVKKENEQTYEQRKKLVRKAIQTLPERQQIILSLRDIQGFSYGEIAKILNVPPGTVDSRLHRARKMLRKKLVPFLTKKEEGYEL
ncbi:MAG: sigma-70 family RNA polymerase sigma factor [Candidatus Aminicenantes bacterium]|nr:MAG: sigma-70 family RNA polymerase sigma factor [Candidatus Aminicenantes bacterium]